MHANLGRQYLEPAINSLAAAFGVKDSVSRRSMENRVSRGDLKGCVTAIARQLGLPIQISLAIVPAGYRAGEQGFTSQALSTVDSDGRGIESITAQVTIPGNLPVFGTHAFDGFPIEVKISSDAAEHPSTLIAAMAHELTHVLLYSLRHPDRKNEVKTDLTAMLLGFAEIMMHGRTTRKTYVTGSVTRTRTTTFGYLSDGDFNYAFHAIAAMRAKRRAISGRRYARVQELKREIRRFSELRETFAAELAQIDRRMPRRVSSADSEKIIALHSSGHAVKLSLLYERSMLALKTVESESVGPAEDEEAAHFVEQHVKSALPGLREAMSELEQSIRILRRQSGVLWRIRSFLQRRRE